ncbi:MAG: hypothetical protein JXR96_23910 [Deltaproteobacteria bacterium]|nr:hypothetical protein [Deltaproteobacteria bacterium]
MNKTKVFSSVLLFTALCGQGSGICNGGEDRELDKITYTLLFADLPVITVGLGAAISGISSIHNGTPNNTGWLVTGYVSSALNIGAGVTWLAIDKGDNGYLLGISIAHLLMGLLDLGITIWSSELTGSDSLDVRISPIMIEDCDRNVAAGFGVEVIGW